MYIYYTPSNTRLYAPNAHSSGLSYHGIISPLYRMYFPLSSAVADVITFRMPATLSAGSSRAACVPISSARARECGRRSVCRRI